MVSEFIVNYNSFIKKCLNKQTCYTLKPALCNDHCAVYIVQSAVCSMQEDDDEGFGGGAGAIDPTDPAAAAKSKSCFSFNYQLQKYNMFDPLFVDAKKQDKS